MDDGKAFPLAAFLILCFVGIATIGAILEIKKVDAQLAEKTKDYFTLKEQSIKDYLILKQQLNDCKIKEVFENEINKG